MNVKNKVVIVTGASSGIGLATAKLLTQKGAKIALVARSKEKLIQLSKILPNSLAVSADMSVEKEIKKMVRKVFNHYGRIDILVNNAGRGYDSALEEIDAARMRELYELDLIGPLIAMQQVIPIMRKQGGGTIVNISSGTSLMYLPNMSAYSSSKRALNGLTLTAREELGKYKIVVSVVYPYITQTDFDKNMMKKSHDQNLNEEEYDGNLPPSDTAEYIAGKIVDVIKSGEAEQFAHDWMKKLAK